MQDDRPDRDAGVEVAVRQCVADRPAVRPAPVALELGDDLHRPDLRRAGDGPGREAGPQQLEGAHALAELADHLGDEVGHVREALRLHEALDMDASCLAHAREVVSAEIDQHHVLGAVLLRLEQALGVARPGRGRAGDRVEARPPSLDLDEGLRRGADQGDLAELEEERVRRGVDAAKRAVEVERARRGRSLGPLRDDDLEGVARADVLLRALDRALVLEAAGVTLGRRGRPFAARQLGRRRVEQRAQLVGVAAENLGEAARVVEAHQRVGDDEPALRQVGPVGGELHRRLERRDVVVGEVADDGRRRRLRLGEIDRARAAADERVPPEAPAFDRLEQERRFALAAQPDVRAERRDQVCWDDGRVGQRR